MVRIAVFACLFWITTTIAHSCPIKPDLHPGVRVGSDLLAEMFGGVLTANYDYETQPTPLEVGTGFYEDMMGYIINQTALRARPRIQLPRHHPRPGVDLTVVDPEMLCKFSPHPPCDTVIKPHQAAVPEPPTILLILSCLIVLVALVKKFRWLDM